MIEAELPDGTILEFPPGTSPDVVQNAVKQRLGAPTTSPAEKRRERRDYGVTDALRDVVGGAVRGAGSIGATILSPYDIAKDLIAGKGLTLESNRERRAGIDGGLREFGVDTDSLAYKGGKIATEIAGTAGVGGVLAKGAQAVGASPMLVQALRTAGMSSGATGAKALAARVAGGAATGGAAAGLVNPEDAGTGAIVGGALPLAMQVAKGAVNVGRNVLGKTSGAGEAAIQTAYDAGKAGGAQGQAFRDNMRGAANMTDVLDDARANLATMRQNASATYRQNMANVKTDRTVLDLNPVSQSVQDAVNKFTFKGQARNPKVLEKLQEVASEVDAWKKLDPAEFHTPEGLDALKQRIGGIMQDIPFEARDVRSAVGDVYNSVKGQIQAQAPTYSKAMKQYSEASELLDEITRSLSLGQNKTADTALRKLQSVMRNNANTNYGARAASLGALEQQGGRALTPALAGQALNDWMPRGIQGAAMPTASGLMAATGNVPAAAANLAISSPRLVGEAAHAAGRVDPVIQALRRQLYLGAPVVAAQD